MDINRKAYCKKVKEALATMEYGEKSYSIKEAEEFLLNYEPHMFKVSDPPGEQNEFEIVDFEPREHEEIGDFHGWKFDVIRFAEEIKKSTELIVQLELLLRDIPPKDTRQSLSVMQDFHCNFGFRKHRFLQNSGEFYFRKHDSLVNLAFRLVWLGNKSVKVLLAKECAYVFDLLLDLALKSGATGWIFDVEFYYGDGDDRRQDKAPMIVFNNADILSACYSCVDATWAHQGLLPWSVGTVLVQDDVLDEFTRELKRILTKIKMGFAYDCQAQVNFPISIKNYQGKFKKCLKDARDLGIEVFAPGSLGGSFAPALLIGGRVYGNSVMPEHMTDGVDVSTIPILTVLGFRDAKEAVALANNCRNEVAISVWTEKIGLANEVAMQLDCSTVWVNCFNKLTPEMQWPLNRWEYFQPRSVCLDFALNLFAKNPTDWPTLSSVERCRRLYKFASDGSNKGFKSEIIESVLRASSKCDDFDSMSSAAIRHGGKYTVSTYAEAVGVVVIHLRHETEDLIEAAMNIIAQGNRIIVVYHSDVDDSLLRKFSELMPNIFNICNARSDVDSCSFGDQIAIKYDNGRVIWQNINKKLYFLKTKTVWQSIGDTYCC